MMRPPQHSFKENVVSSSVRLAALLLLTLLSASISLRAQAPTKPAPPKAARGTVSGRVTIKDRPAPGVVIGIRKTLRSTTFPEPFKTATTDQDGNYRITNLTAGAYDILPSAQAYIVAGGNILNGKSVVVGEDEQVEDINFSLIRGGVITGKITDADGRPVIQQQVYLYRLNDLPPNARQIWPTSSGQTDDRGIYRFFGLVAGPYRVAAGRGEGAFAGTYNSTRVIYKQVFHPDTTDFAKAKVVDVREGSEAADVDIALGRAIQTFSVSGKVIDSDSGMPAPNVRFGLQRRVGDRFETVDNFLGSNSQGDVAIDGLVPGRYGIFLLPNENSELRAEAVTFDVVDQDVTMLTVRLTKGSAVSGVVVFEHENKSALAKLLELRLQGQLAPPSGLGFHISTSPIASDGSFRLGGLSAGRLFFGLTTANGNNPPKGFIISRIEHNGAVMPNGLEVKDKGQLIGVRVFISYGTAGLRGIVNVDRNLMPEGSRIYASLMKPGTQGDALLTTVVDARGHFVMDAIPAGVYELVVRLTGKGTNPGRQTVTQQVTLQDGVVSDVSLTLELAQPNPD